ncbi:MAG TPA: DUF6443 domain-containing protein, partial [Chitinophagaceae bacterium]|nr:DUF6443 domain-containing protein [Chitinophagaceae bacterium]
QVRWEGNWNYAAKLYSSGCTSGCPTGVVFFAGHEVSLNWQYSVTFAEEGKKKEVISYFDGSLRNRQSVTLNNTDNKTIIQESIFDVLGRPTVNILPVPADDSTLHYFKGFNKNTSGDPYSFSDLSEASCITSAAAMDTSSGASKYYSANNPFLNNYYYSKYIPDAHTYPFTVTQYVADNTGRILAQGGVDTTFQIGHGHETNYFYGKPSQTELDRLFGNEAGPATHYLKNMVVDPNGQISVSYVDASGKTVATALAGSSPTNLHPLPSSVGAKVQMNDELMSPRDFSVNSSNYTISASATILAPVTGTYVLSYEVDPLEYQKLYGPEKDSVICSTCYYDLLITVKDNCENVLHADSVSAGNVFDTTCENGTAITGTMNVDINKIGEYYVYYQLRVSQDALNFFDSVHLEKNSDVQKLDYFLLNELKQTDFSGCYNNCQTCFDKLGDKPDFVSTFKSIYVRDSLSFSENDSLWVLTLYDSLYAHCQAIQSECTHESICDQKLDLLKMDVSPGGQYALYDTNFVLLERPINRLDTAWRHRISSFLDENGNPDSITLYTTEGEDSVRIPVNQLNDSMFIANWKDSWADSLVKLHPEYCNYLWCITNSNSYDFDNEIEEWQDADSVRAMGWFDSTNYYALLDHDPFFTSGGLGESLYSRMKDSLRLFSRSLLGLSQPDKNILQFVDIILYCKNQYNAFDSCVPDSACRAPNREWLLYKELYLNLKQKFYEEARRTSTDSVFANCSNCFIGSNILGLSGISCIAPPLSDFSLGTAVTPTGSLASNALVFRNQEETTTHPLRVYLRHHIIPDVDGFPDFFDTAFIRFAAGTNYFVIGFSPHDIIDGIVGVECDTTSYEPFTDSTCNYHCAGGVYDPYDRDSVSLYVEYGNPNSSPSSIPSGYGACNFYSVFDLKTGPSSSCKFYNVWVCVYDSTC